VIWSLFFVLLSTHLDLNDLNKHLLPFAFHFPVTFLSFVPKLPTQDKSERKTIIKGEGKGKEKRSRKEFIEGMGPKVEEIT